MTCNKRTYQNIMILLLYFFLRALRGYNILYFECFRYFFTKNLSSDNLTLIKTIPENAKYCQYWEFLGGLTGFWQEKGEYSQKKKKLCYNNERKI